MRLSQVLLGFAVLRGGIALGGATVDAQCGGRERAPAVHFVDDGKFDQIYQAER